MNISDAIKEEAAKLLRRHQRYAADLYSNAKRLERETGGFVQPIVQIPNYWRVDRGFSPYYVRSKAEQIGFAIRRALDESKYAPFPAAEYEVPKSDGGVRKTSVFQVADNALSRLVFKSLMAKNTARLSPRCYAFRTDIGRHDAIFYAYEQLRTHLRVYVAEFDFKAFFDTLRHEHILRVLSSRQFVTTKREREIVGSFLRTPSLAAVNYSRGTTEQREEGIPQGTSISLFLANIAAFPLDQRLERLGVGFVRYADDTLIWSSKYDELSRAVDAISDISELMGVRVNLKKSPGIALLRRDGEAAEITGKTHVHYLGVSLSKDHLSLKPSVVARMKKRISFIIYRTLLQPLKHGKFMADRIAPPVDRSYVTVLFQIRRYLYGGLSVRSEAVTDQRVPGRRETPP